jgi:Cu+-exporting ATPase
MGNGADVSVGLSDIVILDNKLDGVIDSFIISKRTYKFIKQNLTISLVYNIVTIPLAVFGYVIPLIAALSMSLSSLLVVGNSLRIKKK